MEPFPTQSSPQAAKKNDDVAMPTKKHSYMDYGSTGKIDVYHKVLISQKWKE